MAFSRLKRKTEADTELALFKQLEEERKKRRLDADDVENVEVDGPPATPVQNASPKIP
jgi:hypothetical protein